MTNPVSTHRSLALLAVLVAGIVSSAFTEHLDSGRAVLFIAHSLLGIGGAYLLGAGRRWQIAAWSIVLPMIVANLVTFGTEPEPVALGIAAKLFAMALIGLLLAVVLKYSLLTEDSIHKADRILAGICGYLLIALFWSSLYATIELSAEGSFSDPHGAAVTRLDFLYFSLTSLTTLGYGDVLPITGPARIFSVLESVFGVLYLAVFISTLVAIQGKRQA
jgi:voltage-gated potassium channel Kch